MWMKSNNAQNDDDVDDGWRVQKFQDQWVNADIEQNFGKESNRITGNRHTEMGNGLRNEMVRLYYGKSAKERERENKLEMLHLWMEQIVHCI